MEKNAITFDHSAEHITDCIFFAGMSFADLYEAVDETGLKLLQDEVGEHINETRLSPLEIAKILIELTNDSAIVAAIATQIGAELVKNNQMVKAHVSFSMLAAMRGTESFSQLIERNYKAVQSEPENYPEKDKGLFELSLMAMNYGMIAYVIQDFKDFAENENNDADDETEEENDSEHLSEMAKKLKKALGL